MSTPRALWSTGQVAAQRFNRAFPGLQGGRRAGLAPVSAKVEKRRRRSHPTASYPWLQGPDYEITVPFGGQQVWYTGVRAARGTSDSTILGWLRDGINLSSGPTAGLNGAGDIFMDVGIDAYGEYPEFITAGVHAAAMSVAGPVTLFTGESYGAYIPPTPPPGYVLEYEAGADRGQMVGDVTVAGEIRAGGDGDYTPGGSLWWTNEGVGTYRTPAHIIANYNQFLTVPEQVSAPFSVTLDAATVFGTGDQGAVDMVVHPVSEAMTNTASAGRYPPDDGTVIIYNHEVALLGANPTLTATVRPPRHRFVPAPTSGDWTASIDWNAYVWDAGLFLGDSFADLAGLPTSLPSGCSELHYYVAPAAADVVAHDYTEPYGDYYIGSGYSGNEVSPLGSAPDAGSHVWVIWFGPAFNVLTDPEPSLPPAPLIPASIAENGTG